MRLKVELPKGWADYSHENPDGPPTFLRDSSDGPGALQMSVMEYKGGEMPDPSEEDLRDMSVRFGQRQGWGELIESSGGGCALGRLGTAVFRSNELPRVQVWHLSNGRDFILATHIFACNPDPKEVQEAEEIVKTVTLGPEKPKWKFW